MIRVCYPWIALLLWGAPLLGAESKSPLDDAAEEATHFLFNESWEKLRSAEKESNLPPRETDYLKAVLLLNLQPKTEANLNESALLFESVRKMNSEDDFGIASLYFLGRIAQTHRAAPDLVKAEAIYRELIRKYPTHPLTQQAIVKLTLLRIYSAESPSILIARLSEVESLTTLITAPSAASSFHYILGDALIRYKKDLPLGLKHFIEVDKIGIQRRQERADTFVRIAEIARTLHQNTTAIIYYEKFLSEFPRDMRTHLVRESLASLQKPSTHGVAKP